MGQEKSTAFASHSPVSGRISFGGQPAHGSHWHDWDISVFRKRLVVGLNRVIVASDYIFTAGFAVGGVEEAWVQFEHFPEVLDRLLVVLLLLCEFCTGIE